MDTKRCFFKCVLVLYLVERLTGEDFCPEGQEYKTCGPACRPTCKDRNPSCQEPCVAGCFCKDNQVLSGDGSCINDTLCSENSTHANKQEPILIQISCGAHQVYSECKKCERTCASPNPACDITCAAGCFCIEGFVKAPSGECVKVEACPQAETMMIGGFETSIEECMSDEVFVFCGGCEATCVEPRPLCPADYCTRGCVCRPPLLRHYSGHCVEQKYCEPQKCLHPNEEYGCKYGCEEQCVYKECPRSKRCRLGCHCKLGFYRTSSRACVPPEQCLPNYNKTITSTSLIYY